MTEDILDRLEKRYAAGCELLSKQEDRELLSVAAFLAIAGIEFEASNLKRCQSQPPDVIFQPAVSSQRQTKNCSFEVTELLGGDTKRNHEMWESHKIVEYTNAQGLTFKNYVSNRNVILKPKTAITFAALLDLIQKSITAKNIKYRKRKIKTEDIDLLINIQLKNIFMKPDEKIYSPDSPLIKEWRSISFLMAPYCGVLYLSEYAPPVLRDLHGRGLIYVNNRPEIWDEMIEKISLQ